MMPRNLLAAPLAAMICAALFLAALRLGPLGVMLGLLTPLAPAYLVLRQGVLPGLLAIGAAALGLGAIGSVQGSLTFLAIYGPVALVLPLVLRQGGRWDLAVLLTLGIALVLATTGIVIHQLQSDVTVSQLVEKQIRSELTTLLKAQPKSLTAEQKQNMQQVGEQMVELGRRAWPGMGALGMIGMVLLNLWALGRLAAERLPWGGQRFADWKTPERLIWLLIAVGFLMVAPWSPGRTVGLNLLLVLLPFYFLHGLAVVTHLLQRWQTPPVLRVVTYGVIFLINPMPLLIAGMGVFDLWFDFRRPRSKTD